MHAHCFAEQSRSGRNLSLASTDDARDCPFFLFRSLHVAEVVVLGYCNLNKKRLNLCNSTIIDWAFCSSQRDEKQDGCSFSIKSRLVVGRNLVDGETFLFKALFRLTDVDG